MKREFTHFLEDISESINLINNYIKTANEEIFHQNLQLQDSVIRRLEIIGEAVKNIPDEIRVQYPEIPWRQIAGLRDVMIHEYFNIKKSRIWLVITNDLPVLRQTIDKMISHFKNQ